MSVRAPALRPCRACREAFAPEQQHFVLCPACFTVQQREDENVVFRALTRSGAMVDNRLPSNVELSRETGLYGVRLTWTLERIRAYVRSLPPGRAGWWEEILLYAPHRTDAEAPPLNVPAVVDAVLADGQPRTAEEVVDAAHLSRRFDYPRVRDYLRETCLLLTPQQARARGRHSSARLYVVAPNVVQLFSRS